MTEKTAGKSGAAYAVDPEIGALPEGSVSLKVHRQKPGGGWRQAERAGEDGSPGQSLFAVDEVPLGDLNAYGEWLRGSFGPGCYRVQFFRDTAGRLVLAGTGRPVTVAAPKKKARAHHEQAAPAKLSLDPLAEALKRIDERSRELDRRREEMHTQQIEQMAAHHRAMLELVLARTAASAPVQTTSPEATELRIELARIKAERETEQRMAGQLARARRAPAPREEEEEEEEDDDENEGIVERLADSVVEKALERLGPMISGLVTGKA